MDVYNVVLLLLVLASLMISIVNTVMMIVGGYYLYTSVKAMKKELKDGFIRSVSEAINTLIGGATSFFLTPKKL